MTDPTEFPFPPIKAAVRYQSGGWWVDVWWVDVWWGDEVLTYSHAFTRAGGWLRVARVLWRASVTHPDTGDGDE